ncbi:hypothetical protein CV102_03035 [Natronococcus pandeyae]|uniref:C2H2-type domain-containing protein n=1 Tax=Natronococcus pandeyae TaxID=2055836 RepID=A0A8J8Q9L5_9EURY|nr:hypothetical protein [Natronococcus pandeyae]TYL40559.1 hypothetical protein CV102_03035 [Natronococcus pandeyae]
MAGFDTEAPNAESGERSDAADAAGPPTVSIRGDESPVRCPYCGQPFHERRLRTLHCGLEHPDRLSERERAAFERAYVEEGAEIRRFRLYALGTLILVYFVMLFLYAFVT